MKKLFVSMIALTLTACGSDQMPQRYSSAPSQSADAEQAKGTESIAASQENRAFENKNLMSETAAKAAIASAEKKISVEVTQKTELDVSHQKSFMKDVKIEVEAAFCSAKAKNGKQLSKEHCIQLAASFMLVIEAASSKDALKTSAAWNGFIKTAQKMNGAARLNAAGNGGLIADILGLGVDIINLAVDLIAAVLALDVAGVVNVALDAIDTVIDFLV